MTNPLECFHLAVRRTKPTQQPVLNNRELGPAIYFMKNSKSSGSAPAFVVE